jgi:hypothetical protein
MLIASIGIPAVAVLYLLVKAPNKNKRFAKSPRKKDILGTAKGQRRYA